VNVFIPDKIGLVADGPPARQFEYGCEADCIDFLLMESIAQEIDKAYKTIKKECKTVGELEDRIDRLARDVSFWNRNLSPVILLAMNKILRKEKGDLPLG